MHTEMDMAPYEDQFTLLERYFYERNAAMNIVVYVANRQFTDEQYQRIFNHYNEANTTFEKYKKEFENTVLIPNIDGVFNWEADFERRVVYVSQL